MKNLKNLKKFEKWSKEVDIKSTGENADKSIEEIDKEIAALKKDNKKYIDAGKKVPKKNRVLMSQLIFAKRAKNHWKKSKVNEDLKSNMDGINDIIDRIEELSNYEYLSADTMQNKLEEINELIQQLRFRCE